MDEAVQKELKEILELIPTLTVERLDQLGFRLETELTFMCFGKVSPEYVQTVGKIINAVNDELKRRGLAIRPQDRVQA